MGGGGGLGGLALPESLAGRLEARLQLESQSVDNWRRLDAFLGGLFAALQQMDADMQRCHPVAIAPVRSIAHTCVGLRSRTDPIPLPPARPRPPFLCAGSVKQENARLAAEVKEVRLPAPRSRGHAQRKRCTPCSIGGSTVPCGDSAGAQVNQTLDQKLDAFRARLEESDQKAVQTQIDLAACQAAELTLQQRVRSVEEDLTQSIAETLERERNLDHQLQAVEKRVPTSSELSAIKQQGGKGQDAKDQAGSGGPAERTESNPLGYSQDVRTLEKAMLERLSALRGEVQKQGQDLQATVDGNRLKADSELEVLRNDVAEQVFLIQSRSLLFVRTHRSPARASPDPFASSCQQAFASPCQPCHSCPPAADERAVSDCPRRRRRSSLMCVSSLTKHFALLATGQAPALRG